MIWYSYHFSWLSYFYDIYLIFLFFLSFGENIHMNILSGSGIWLREDPGGSWFTLKWITPPIPFPKTGNEFTFCEFHFTKWIHFVNGKASPPQNEFTLWMGRLPTHKMNSLCKWKASHKGESFTFEVIPNFKGEAFTREGERKLSLPWTPIVAFPSASSNSSSKSGKFTERKKRGPPKGGPLSVGASKGAPTKWGSMGSLRSSSWI